jgi:VanZ family protein
LSRVKPIAVKSVCAPILTNNCLTSHRTLTQRRYAHAMKSNNKWLFQLMFWGAVSTITVFSLLPGAYLPPVAFSVWDKAQHALGFLVLGTLGLGSYPNSSVRVVFGLLTYGAVIELAQAATGWRYGDWQDWLANAVGVALAYGFWCAAKSTAKPTNKAS